jgi:hypothetical protein
MLNMLSLAEFGRIELRSAAQFLPSGGEYWFLLMSSNQWQHNDFSSRLWLNKMQCAAK